MRGVFVSNAYLRGEKFSEPGRMLSAAADELDVTLRSRLNVTFSLMKMISINTSFF